jgi:hypothetical protein
VPQQIQIDDDVYRHLESKVRGFETPNDVLRREFRLPSKTAARRGTRSSAAVGGGALAELIAAGLIHPGDLVEHVQPRRRRRFEGTVESDGYITTKLGSYEKPSPALSALTGGSINGWDAWVHQPSGKTLNQLKAECDNLSGQKR